MTFPTSKANENGHSESSNGEEGKNSSDGNCEISVETIFVTSKFEPDPILKEHTDYYLELFQQSMKLPMGIVLCELETRFDKIRNSEQNLANFIADIMRLETESDCALINTGTFRSNLLFPRGIFTMGDLRLMLPYADLIMQLELTGEQLLLALENGVSKYPALEGRFPAVSGISFEFDPKKEPMKRINVESIRIKGGPLQLNERYTMAAKKWILGGKDGYDVFTKVKIITDESVADELHSMVKRFFELAHDHNFLDLYRLEKEGVKSPSHGKICHKKLHFYEKMKELISDIVDHEGTPYVAINPQVEGRIKIL